MEDLLICGNTISDVWYKMLDSVLSKPGVNELAPVLVSLQNFDPEECEQIDPVRQVLDNVFKKRNLNSINTVANTIFPLSLYRLAKFDREQLYRSYLAVMPRRKAIDVRNKDGLYFERLIAFDESEHGNQLEFIISEFTGRRGVRRSLLQAAIFDPRRDHKRNAQIAFPCLQHVSFVYSGNQLSVNAFYATQQLFDKAYGNMLGLVRLGNFMAREMHLSLNRVNCYVGVEKLERITRQDEDLKLIVNTAKQYFKYE